MGIVYLVQPEEFLNTNVYKIGRSGVETLTRPHSGYGKNYKTIYVNNCKDEKLIENLLKYYFKNNFKLVKGLEYFEGNIEDMKQTYTYIVMEFEKTANNKILYPLNNNTKLEKNENTENIQKIENTESTDNNQIFDTSDNIAKNSKTENKESENNKNEEKILINKYNKIIDINNTYEVVKQKFEERNFKLLNPICYCQIDRDGRILKTNKTNFGIKYSELVYTNIINNNGGKEIKECKFIEKWFEDIDKRSYSRINFYPYGENSNLQNTNENYYNLFNGYLINKDLNQNLKEDEDFELILNYLKELTNHNEEDYNYFLNYLAHIIQKPYERIKLSLIFKKKYDMIDNIFFDWFGKKILGANYYLRTVGVDSVMYKNKLLLENKILILLYDIEKSELKKIKECITEDELNIKRKNENAYYINNNSYFICFTNLDTDIELEKDEKKFIIFTSPKNKIEEYSEKLVNIFKSDNYNYTFYNYLKERDLTNVNLLDKSITEISVNDIKHQLSIIPDFFANFLFSDYAKDVKNNFKEVIEYSATSLFEFFQTFNTKYGYSKNEYSMKRFSLELQNDYSDCIEKKRKSDGQHLFIKRKELIKNLIKNNYLEKDEIDDNQIKISLFTNNK